MDLSPLHRITLNLGHKRWAAERGPVQLFSRAQLKVVSYSEEHTVLEHPAEEKFEVGDYVLIAPRHVCPTVNLYEDFTLMGTHGQIEIASSPVDGRNR
jgi:D-serine deaminase-like pyridoxal phosphate-dependent protein